MTTWVLCAGDGPGQVLIVILFVGIVIFLSWLQTVLGRRRAEEDAGEASRAELEPRTEATRPPPEEVLRRFLEEMTGVPVGAPPIRHEPQRHAPRSAERYVSRRRATPAEAKARQRETGRKRPHSPQHLVADELEELPSEVAPTLALGGRLSPRERKPREGGRDTASVKVVVPDVPWMSRLPANPLQRAVLLSEILGQPRSRQPFRGR